MTREQTATVDQHEEAWAKIHDLLAAGHWELAREIFDQAVSATLPRVKVRGPREDGRYDLYFGDESLGSHELNVITPLANGIGRATGQYKDAATVSAPVALATDPGTEKLLRTMLDRAYKMMLQAGYRVMEHDPNHNDPIIAWMSDARHVLYGSGAQPDLARLT